MKKGMRSNADGVLEKKRRSQKWKRLAGVLGCLVVIVTAYVLMRPAETLERELICGTEEHQHSVEQGCYQEIAAEPAQPICGMEEAGHVHSEECYSEESVLTCTEPEGDGHQHGESCYTMETTLICDLPEADGHTHTAECYPAEDAEATPELELVCELPEHTHTEDCYADDAAQHAQVEEVAALIDVLPSAEEVEARLAELLAADDAEAYDAYCAELARQVEQANAAYEALTDEQKAQLNIDKLTALFVYLPAKEGTFTLTAPATKNGITVTISGETASLPFPVEDLTLTAVEVEDENANALRDEALESEELTAAENYMLDIRLMHGDEEVQPTGPITVTFAGLPLDGGADVALVDDVDDNADTDAEPVAYQAKEMTVQAVAANAADDTDMSDETTDDTADDAGESYVTGPKVYQIDEDTQQATEVDVAVNDENNVVLETEQLTNLYSVSVLATGIKGVATAAALKNACELGGWTVRLGKDIVFDQEIIKIQNNKNTTLDLNGFKIILSDDGIANGLFLVTDNSTLTIKDRKSDSTQMAEKVVSNTCRTANYDSDNSTLTYYVTYSTENDSVNHTTKETTKEYTVVLGGGNAGAIIGPSEETAQCIFTGRNATINIEGGYICNFYTLRSNGTIVINGSKVTMSGGVIAGNSHGKGGAFYIQSSYAYAAKMTMTGGIISGNTVNWYGGGVDLSGIADGDNYQRAVFTMTGGYITNNLQMFDDSNRNTGGGVFVDYTADFVMAGGYITSNVAYRGGGIGLEHVSDEGVPELEKPHVSIHGGYISMNVANKGTGGGIDLGTSTICEIKADSGKKIYISNNSTLPVAKWGGGGVYVGHRAKLSAYNVLAINNIAYGLGGGVAACPASDTFIFENQGIASFNNVDGGTSPQFVVRSDGKTDSDSKCFYYEGASGNPKPYALSDAGNTHSDMVLMGKSMLYATMLGNSSPNWVGSKDGMKLPALACGEYVTVGQVMGVKSSPSSTDAQKAKDTADVYVTGNTSATHGGGIMSNGIVFFGNSGGVTTVPLQLDLLGMKELLDSIGKVATPIGFQFSVTDITAPSNPKVVQTVTSDANGQFMASLEFDNPGTYMYQISEVSTTSPNIKYDMNSYTLTVKVTDKVELKTYNGEPTGIYTYGAEISVINDASKETVFTGQFDGNNWGSQCLTVAYLRKSASGGAAFTNQLKKEEYSVNVTKVDSEEETSTLSGAEFKLEVKNGTAYTDVSGTSSGTSGVYTYAASGTSGAVTTFVTAENGNLQIVGLPAGEYKLTETKAPDGFLIADEWQAGKEFKLNKTDAATGAYTVTVADPPATYIFQFLKVSEADKTKPVPNAKYQLLDSTGQEVKFTKTNTEYQYSASGTVTELITDKNGRFQLTGLPRGSYTLREIEAPTGFGLANDYSFTLSLEETTNQVFTYTQEEPVAYELPETGGGGAKPYVITGAALLVGAACLMVCRDKRRKAGGRTF